MARLWCSDGRERHFRKISEAMLVQTGHGWEPRFARNYVSQCACAKNIVGVRYRHDPYPLSYLWAQESLTRVTTVRIQNQLMHRINKIHQRLKSDILMSNLHADWL